MNTLLRLSMLCALLGAFGLLNTGCGAEEKSASFTLPSSGTDDDDGGGGGTGPIGDTTSTVFAVRSNFDPRAVTFLHKTGSDWSAKCEIPRATVLNPAAPLAERHITCMLEVNELDLWFWPFKLSNPVPSNLCEFTAITPYWYFAYRPGAGPTAGLSWDVTASGSITNFNDPSGLAVLRNVGGTSQVSCIFDYTASGGPNCCTGNYTATVTTYTDADDPTKTEVDTVSGSWGGNRYACASGPGKQFKTNAAGMPIGVIYNTNAGSTLPLDLTAEAEIPVGANVYYANHYVGATRVAIQQPDYLWQCYDQNAEVKASIKLKVREWNTQSQFVLKASGDPDETGTEDNGSEKNDLLDWDDFAAGDYPGAGS